MGAENRRDNGRGDILGEPEGEGMGFFTMQISQISSGGAQIDTPFPLHLNSLHALRLTLGGNSIIVKGRIVHSSISDVEHEHVMY